jgi:hypothetical protein
LRGFFIAIYAPHPTIYAQSYTDVRSLSLGITNCISNRFTFDQPISISMISSVNFTKDSYKKLKDLVKAGAKDGVEPSRSSVVVALIENEHDRIYGEEGQQAEGNPDGLSQQSGKGNEDDERSVEVE